MNEYLSACNRSYYIGRKMKRQVDDAIGWYILRAVQSNAIRPITTDNEADHSSFPMA